MNYDWLFSFAVFADSLNFTRAAERLHLSQPALHAQIRKLAESVGRPLYRRKGRGLVLTSEGQRLAAYGREVDERGSAVLDEVRGSTSLGPVIFASGEGAFLYLLGTAIRRFPKHKWPLRLLTMRGPEAIEAVRDARVHLAVVGANSVPEGVDSLSLRAVGQMVVLPYAHRLAKRNRVCPADLAGERIIVPPVGSPHRTTIAQTLAAAGVTWEVAVEAMGWELMLHFARYQVGIAIVNGFCDIPRGMVGIPLSDFPPVTYYLLERKGLRSQGVETLRALIVETLGQE